MKKRLFFAVLWGAVLPCALASASAATPLLVLDARPLEAPAARLAASLQGIANRTPEAPRVFVLTRDSDELWLAYAARAQSQPAQTVTLDQLLAQVKPYLNGQVLYDPQKAFTLDAASTMAGLQGAALSDRDLGLNTLYDFRTKWDSPEDAYTWIMETLPRQANHHQLALLPPDSAMRDYAIAEKMITLTPGAGFPAPDFHQLLLRFDPGSIVYARTVRPCSPRSPRRVRS